MTPPPNPDSIRILADRTGFDKQTAAIIENGPLYRTYEFDGELREPGANQYRSWWNLHLPTSFVMYCEQCKFRQPYDTINHSSKLSEMSENGASSLCVVIYGCRACRSQKHYWFEVACTSEGVRLVKVGQRPALELVPPEVLVSVMSDSDLRLYRRALTCRNSNFGIAAVAYLRRIVENETNSLIDLIAERMNEEEPQSELLKKVEEVKRAYSFSEKMDFAKELLPKSVLSMGQNPVSHLHALTSEALHSMSDEESVDVFDRCQLAFEYVIQRLKQNHDGDVAYKAAVAKLHKQGGKS